MADGKIVIDTKLDPSGAEKGIKGLQRKLDNVGGKMKDVGGKMSGFLTAPILAGFGLATKGTEEFRQDLARLDQNARDAGVGTDKAREALKRLSGVSDETDSNIEAVSNLLATGFDENQMVQAMDALSGAAIKFPDTMKIEGMADGLQETLATGKAIGPFAEMLERMGVDLEEFDKGLEKAKESGEEQNYIMEQLADTGLAKVNEEYRKNNEELVKSKESQQSFQQALAELGETLQPIVTGITEGLQKMMEWFNQLSPGMQNVILIVLALVAVLGPLLMVIGFVATGVAAMSATFLMWTGIILGVVAVVAIIVVLIITYWDQIKMYTLIAWTATVNFFKAAWEWMKQAAIATGQGIWNFIKSVWNWIKTTTMTIWNGIANFFKAIWNGIKSATMAVINGIKTGIKTAWNFIKTTTTTVWNGIKSFFTTLWENIGQGVDAFKEKFIGVWEAIKEGVRGVVNAIASIVNGLITIIENMINSIGGAINSLPSFDVPDWVPGVGGGSFSLPNIPSISLPRVPSLDVGTNFVAQDGLAMLHAGEAVVPKEYNPAAGGAGGQMQASDVNIDGEKVGEIIWQPVSRNMQKAKVKAKRGRGHKG